MLRFGLSPTEDIHIGNMRIALISYVIARQRDEQFMVRIEDTDKEGDTKGKDQETLDILKKFALHHDQLLYQSDNLGRHQQFALSLIEKDKAFACICTPKELEADRERAKKSKERYRYSQRCLHNTKEVNRKIKDENLPYTIRIKKPDETITFTDKIKGKISTEPNEMDSFVILKADSTPTRDFATACDDMLCDISTVVREEDHIANASREVYIKHSLGYMADTQYVHLPMMLNESGEKISKEDDTSSIGWMLYQGFLPDAIINCLLQLGNKTPHEVFVLPDAIEWFDLSGISKSPVKLDMDKLRLLNRRHLSKMEDKSLSRIFGFADASIGKLLKLYLEESSTINELEGKIKALFAPKECQSERAEEMVAVSDAIQKAPMLDTFDSFRQYIIDESGLESKKLLETLQILIVGTSSGPELSDVYPLIKPYITEIARCQS